MSLDSAIVQNLLRTFGDKYSSAKGTNRWRPPPGTYSALYVELEESTYTPKGKTDIVLRWAPVFELLDGELKGKRFSSNAMLTNNEGSMGDFHAVVETLCNHPLPVPNMAEDRQLMLDAAGKVVVSITVAERATEKGSFPDDKLNSAQPVTAPPPPATA